MSKQPTLSSIRRDLAAAERDQAAITEKIAAAAQRGQATDELESQYARIEARRRGLSDAIAQMEAAAEAADEARKIATLADQGRRAALVDHVATLPPVHAAAAETERLTEQIRRLTEQIRRLEDDLAAARTARMTATHARDRSRAALVDQLRSQGVTPQHLKNLEAVLYRRAAAGDDLAALSGDALDNLLAAERERHPHPAPAE